MQVRYEVRKNKKAEKEREPIKETERYVTKTKRVSIAKQVLIDQKERERGGGGD